MNPLIAKILYVAIINLGLELDATVVCAMASQQSNFDLMEMQEREYLADQSEYSKLEVLLTFLKSENSADQANAVAFLVRIRRTVDEKHHKYFDMAIAQRLIELLNSNQQAVQFEAVSGLRYFRGNSSASLRELKRMKTDDPRIRYALDGTIQALSNIH